MEQDSFPLSFESKHIENYQYLLLNWFEENGRHDLPWKLSKDGSYPDSGELLDPYRIWIAEVMLQQTKLNVVLPYWKRWMLELPTLVHLAKANREDVLLLWQGLGYYSRAHRVFESAKILLELIGSADPLDPLSWPNNLETWTSLPGIGRTTAASIISSAFDLPGALLDGNVKRVIGRLIANPRKESKSLVELWNLSEALLDRNNPRRFNQAFMDLGAIVCTPKKPNCCNCPWNTSCRAYSSQAPSSFPVKVASIPMPLEIIGVGVVLNDFGQVLIDQRLQDSSMGGMWEFPGGKQEKGELIQQTIKRELREEVDIEVTVGELLIALDHSYSHKKLRFVVHLCKCVTGEPKPLKCQQILWVYPRDLSKYPFPAANSKMIEALIKYKEQAN